MSKTTICATSHRRHIELLRIALYLWAAALSAQTPSREYIRLNGRVIAIESVTPMVINGSLMNGAGQPFNPGATITVTGATVTASGTSYTTGALTAGQYTVTSTVPTGYSVSYSVAQDGANPTAFVAGYSVPVTVQTGHFTQVNWQYVLPSVTINPAPPLALGPGQDTVLSAALVGLTGVNWTVSGAASPPPPPPPAGCTNCYRYLAPDSIVSATQVTVRATGNDLVTYAERVINLSPSPQFLIDLQPANPAALNSGGSIDFTATVQGRNDYSLTWNDTYDPPITGPRGVLQEIVAGNTHIRRYIAPTPNPSSPTTASITVTATSASDVRPKTVTVALNPPPPVVGVTIEPPSTSASPILLSDDQVQQFLAHVTGTSNQGVTWTASLGSFANPNANPAVYTAPAPTTPAGNRDVTVTATSTVDVTKSAQAWVRVRPFESVGISVKITPQSLPPLLPSQQVQFSADVPGTTNKAVDWYSPENTGQIDQNGLYTANSTVNQTGSFQVIAVSRADPTKSDARLFTILSSANVSVNPSEVSLLRADQTIDFTAVVTGVSNPNVIWALSPPNDGSFLSIGLTSVTYKAPTNSSILAQRTIHVIAKSAVDETRQAWVDVTLIPTPVVSLGPPTAIVLRPERWVQLVPSITEANDQSFTWSKTPTDVGTLDEQLGLYTAPVLIPAEQTVTIRITSNLDPSRFAEKVITLKPGLSANLSPAGQPPTILEGQQIQFSATVTGGDPNLGVFWSSTGTVNQSGLFTAPPLSDGQPSLVQMTVTATSVEDETYSWIWYVNVTNAKVLVLPPAPALTIGMVHDFTRTVSGLSSQDVNWSRTGPGGGTLTPLGATARYRAPLSIPFATTDTVSATSVLNSNFFGSSQISLYPPPPLWLAGVDPVDGAGVTQTFNFRVGDLNNLGELGGAYSITSVFAYFAPLTEIQKACKVELDAVSDRLRVERWYYDSPDWTAEWNPWVAIGEPTGNEYCTINTWSVTRDGNLLTLTLNITFMPTIPSPLLVSEKADDNHNDLHHNWGTFGTWVPRTPPTITTGSPLQGGTVGSNYAPPALQAAGGTPGYSWLLDTGGLPPGLSLISTTGAFSGIPTTAGTYVFTLRVTDAATASATKVFSLTITGAPLSITTTSPLPGGTAGTAYPQALAAAGGVTPRTWALDSGTLPAGLSLSPAGVFIGTPMAAGTSVFTVRVTDNAAAFVTTQLSLTIAAAPSISTTSPLAGWTMNSGYSQTLGATGGTTPLTWMLDSGTPPAGLILSPTGTLSGTPTAAGTSVFTVRVTDNAGAFATKSLSLTINVAPSISTTSPLPGGTVATDYPSQSLAATGGTTPYVYWSLESGDLPAGMNLSGSSGSLYGTPTTAGTYVFTVRVTDSAGAVATKQLSLTISAGGGSGVQTVTWIAQGQAQVVSNGTAVQKTGGCANCADAGGISQQQITSGDGYVEFTVTETSAKVAGLHTAGTWFSPPNIKFGFYFPGSTSVQILENGSQPSSTSVAVNDVLRIQIASGQVRYYKNSVLVYTSAQAVTYPLALQVRLTQMNVVFGNASFWVP